MGYIGERQRENIIALYPIAVGECDTLACFVWAERMGRFGHPARHLDAIMVSIPILIANGPTRLLDRGAAEDAGLVWSPLCPSLGTGHWQWHVAPSNPSAAGASAISILSGQAPSLQWRAQQRAQLETMDGWMQQSGQDGTQEAPGQPPGQSGRCGHPRVRDRPSRPPAAGNNTTSWRQHCSHLPALRTHPDLAGLPAATSLPRTAPSTLPSSSSSTYPTYYLETGRQDLPTCYPLSPPLHPPPFPSPHLRQHLDPQNHECAPPPAIATFAPDYTHQPKPHRHRHRCPSARRFALSFACSLGRSSSVRLSSRGLFIT